MQTYDLLMLLVLGAATMFGFWKGMAWQVASLASLIVSFFVAQRYAEQLAPMISDHPGWNYAVAMLAIYMGTSFVIWTLFRLVSGAIDRVKLDGFDHQMGAVIGFAKGVLLTIVITFFAVTILPQQQKDMIIASRSGVYIMQILDKSHSVMPPKLHDAIHPYIERIEQGLDPGHISHPSGSYQAQWPDQQQLPGWPTQSNSQSNWPQQQTSQQPSAQPPQQPSVYERQQPAWPSQQSTQPTQSQPTQPAPAWPSQQQTADRPSGAPI